MNKFIGGLVLVILFGITVFLTFAQQNQNTQKPNSEIEMLKNRISVLESKLQTVENTEKMELEAKLADVNAKLADAQTKLLNAEIDKYTGKLKDANDEWLRTWSLWFIGIISFFVVILLGVSGIFWFWLRARADQLIADSVEKSLNGFKEAVAQVNILKNQLEETVGQVNILQDQIRVLEKEHAASVLGNFIHYRPEHYPEQVKALPVQALLDVFNDETRHRELQGKAAEVLTYNKQSPRLISPALKYLNSVVDSDFDWKQNFETQYHMGSLTNFLGYIGTSEAYEGLKKFLERLFTENPEDKDIVLTLTAFSLAHIGNKLNKGDSVSILKGAIPFFRTSSYEEENLNNLSEYFDRFNEPEGIKEILTHRAADRMPDVETRCLELLQKHDPDFVKQWQARKETSNTETEESP